MGLVILTSSVLSVFVFIKDQRGLIWRTTVDREVQSKGGETAIDVEGTPSSCTSSDVGDADADAAEFS